MQNEGQGPTLYLSGGRVLQRIPLHFLKAAMLLEMILWARLCPVSTAATLQVGKGCEWPNIWLLVNQWCQACWTECQGNQQSCWACKHSSTRKQEKLLVFLSLIRLVLGSGSASMGLWKAGPAWPTSSPPMSKWRWWRHHPWRCSRNI